MKVIISIGCLLLYSFMPKSFAQDIPDFMTWEKNMCEYGYRDSPGDRDAACREYQELMQWSKMKPPQYPFSSISLDYNAPYRSPLLINNKQQVLLRYSAYLPDEKKARLEIIDGKHASSFIFPTPFNLEDPQYEFIHVEKTSNDFILFTQNRILLADKKKPNGYWYKYFYLYDRKQAILVYIFFDSVIAEDKLYYQYRNISMKKNKDIIYFYMKRTDDDNRDVFNIFFKFKILPAEHDIECIASWASEECAGIRILNKIAN